MATLLLSEAQTDGTVRHKEVTRELPAIKLHDAGKRRLVATMRSDGTLLIRAKGLKREVVWNLDALYERGIKEGKVR